MSRFRRWSVLPRRGWVAGGAILAALAILPASSGAGGAASPGRLLSASGVAFGGIIELNRDGSNVVNLTSNTFGQVTNNPDGQYKSDFPSVARNGTTVFASSRGGQGWRIYAMNAVGGNLRELTKSGPIGGTSPKDIDPVVSPDGTRVAFVSDRAGLAMSPQETSLTNIYVVNINGSGLHQVTTNELSTREVPSAIHGLTWSPNGKQLAFHGDRIAPVNGGSPDLQDVLGFISPAGTGEQDVVIGDCAGGGAIDWVGGSVLYSFGGAVQGCPETSYVIRNVASGTGITIPATALGTLPAIAAGGARLSPDGTEVAYTEGINSKTELVTMSLNGSNRHQVTVPIATDVWIWWAPGPAVPKPGKLVLDPAAVTLRRGGHSVQVAARLLDAGGHVISDSAADWTMDGLNGGSPVCTTTGLLKATSGTSPQTTLLHATNAGLTAKISVTVR